MAQAQINTVGRRKAAIARIFLSEGTGQILVNKRDYKQYFSLGYLQHQVEKSFKATESEGKYDIKINVRGGGIKGQAEATALGIARALVLQNEEFRKALRAENLLTRDARAVERKKPGLRKARRATQFSKR